jgi:polyhydroxybutyrate depolymerase
MIAILALNTNCAFINYEDSPKTHILLQHDLVRGERFYGSSGKQRTLLRRLRLVGVRQLRDHRSKSFSLDIKGRDSIGGGKDAECERRDRSKVGQGMSRFIHAFALVTLWMVASNQSAAADGVQIVVDGRARTYLLERPAAREPRPTIIMLHGASSPATVDSHMPELGQVVSRAGFVTVRPEAVGGRWNIFPTGRISEVDKRLFEQHGGIPDDVAFLKLVIDDLVRRGVPDTKRIYLAGLSRGGAMALRLACVDVGSFAAIGLLISTMPDATGSDCHPSRPLPALMINGTNDRLLPYAGGLSVRGDSLWPTERLVAFFRQLNGCSEAAQQSVLPGAHAQKIEFELSARCSRAPVHSTEWSVVDMRFHVR